MKLIKKYRKWHPEYCKWDAKRLQMKPQKVANGTPKGCEWFVVRISQWGLPNTYSVAAKDTKWIWNSSTNIENGTTNTANGTPKGCKWNPGRLQMAPQKVANGLCSEFHSEDCPTLTAPNTANGTPKGCKWNPGMLQMAPQKVAKGLCSQFHNEDCPTLTALLLMIQNVYETH